MRNTKTKIIALLASAALVAAFGLTACGGSQQSNQKQEEAPAAEETQATEEEAAEAVAETAAANGDNATTEAVGEAVAVASSLENVDTSNMYAYMGETTLDELMYFAIDDENNVAVLAVVNPKTDEYVSFVGDITSPAENTITITDYTTGNKLTFEMTEASDEGVTIDMGEQGVGKLAACTIDEVVEAFAVIDATGKAVA